MPATGRAAVTGRQAAAVVAGWAAFNGLVALCILFWGAGFGGGTIWSRFMMYGSGVLLVGVAALAVTRPRSARQQPVRGALPSGAPAAAVAMACFLGVLAFAFTVWLAYPALPLLGFAVARWYNELRQRHRASP